MRIEWAVPCDRAEIEGNVGSFHGVSPDQIVADKLPGPLTVRFGCCLVIPPGDGGTQQVLTSTVFSPELDQVGEQQTTLSVPDRPHPVPGWERRRLHSTELTFLVSEPGPYMVEWSASDNSIQVPLLVIAAS